VTAVDAAVPVLGDPGAAVEGIVTELATPMFCWIYVTMAVLSASRSAVAYAAAAAAFDVCTCVTAANAAARAADNPAPVIAIIVSP
jgi:hypothetical protein